MRLSAFDCTARGISNLRGNWELVLVQLAQIAIFWALALVTVVGLVAATGATFLLEVGSLDEWTEAVERLRTLSPDWGSIALLGAGLLIFGTIGSLIYAWFQAGIFSTLERGERQAPPTPRTEWSVFRTFGWRDFVGWGNRWAWRYFLFLGWFFLVATLLLLFVVLFLVMLAIALQKLGGMTALALGCAALVPVFGVVLGMNLWLSLALALLPREELGVLRASRRAFAVLRRRSGAAVLLLLFFMFASGGVSLVFWPLGQGMTMALGGSGLALVAVQVLLTLAQILAGSILTIAFYGSIVALARAELGVRAA